MDLQRLATVLAAKADTVDLTLAAEKLVADHRDRTAALHKVSEALGLPASTSADVLCASIAQRVPKADLDKASTELAAANAKIAKIEATALLAAQNARVEALLAAAKITPAQKASTLQIAAVLDDAAWKAYADGLPVLAHATTYTPPALLADGVAGNVVATAVSLADKARGLQLAATQRGENLSAADAVRLAEQGQVNHA